MQSAKFTLIAVIALGCQPGNKAAELDLKRQKGIELQRLDFEDGRLVPSESGHYCGLQISCPEFSDDSVESLRVIERIALLNLSIGQDCEIPNIAKWIGTNSELRGLCFGGPGVDDQMLDRVAFHQLKLLESLDLSGTSFSSSRVKNFGQNRKLKRLILSKTTMGDAAVAIMSESNWPELSHLNLSDTNITNVGMRALTKMKSLKFLSLNRTRISDDGLKSLSSLDSLEWLDLIDTDVTDKGLASLRLFKNLNTISLSGPTITDEGIRTLQAARSLRRVDLYGTKVTEEALQRLRIAIPGISVALEKTE